MHAAGGADQALTEGYGYIKAGWFVAGDLVVERPCIELDLERGLAAGIGRQCPPGAADLGRHTVIMPGLCNAHSHLLDMVLPECGEGLALEELVAHPHGLKYRLMLERMGHIADAVKALRLDSVLAATYAEYQLVEPLRGLHGGTRILVYPQPRTKEREEIISVLEEYRAVGLDTVFDVTGFLEEFSRRVTSLRARVQVHVSETPDLYHARDYEYAYEIPGAVLIHCTLLDAETLAETAMQKPVVICPTSNATLTGRLPDLSRLLQAWRSGEKPLLGIGTDNAAWNEPLVSLELRSSYLLLRGVGRDVAGLLLYAATIGGHLALGEKYVEAVAASHPAYPHSCNIVSSLVKRLASSTLRSLGFRLSLEEYS